MHPVFKFITRFLETHQLKHQVLEETMLVFELPQMINMPIDFEADPDTPMSLPCAFFLTSLTDDYSLLTLDCRLPLELADAAKDSLYAYIVACNARFLWSSVIFHDQFELVTCRATNYIRHSDLSDALLMELMASVSGSSYVAFRGIKLIIEDSGTLAAAIQQLEADLNHISQFPEEQVE
jgi:hypothetical protein